MQIRVEQGNWITLKAYTSSESAKKEIDITEYLGNESNFEFRFVYSAKNDECWKIDNLNVRGVQ